MKGVDAWIYFGFVFYIMERIELKKIVGYLPFQLKCQYVGIINGSEISKARREYEKENQPYTNWSFYEEIPPNYGLKIGYLKEIKIFKNYWKCFIGVMNTGLKSFYNGNNFKPVLHPISDIQKEILYKGKLIIPMIEICKMITPYYHKIIPVFDFNVINSTLNEEERVYQVRYKLEDEDDIQMLNFYSKNGSLWHTDNAITQEANNFLFELKIDVFNLIGKELAIDINTL